jgi:hypothetical protein
MLKKSVLVLFGIFFFSCFAPTVSTAGSHHKDDDKLTKEFKEAKHKFVSKLDKLLTKYEKTAENKKDAIKKDIKKAVSEFIDKKIAIKKEKIAELQVKINKYEADKNKIIDTRVDFVTSDKGRDKIHKKKAHLDEKKAKATTNSGVKK